jgi:hypothetical protein
MEERTKGGAYDLKHKPLKTHKFLLEERKEYL